MMDQVRKGGHGLSGNSGKQTRRKEQTPERVQQAAQTMAPVSGMQRGYVPQNTGGYRTTGNIPVTGNKGGYRPAGNPPVTGNTGAYYNSMTGSQRGYMPAEQHTYKQNRKGKGTTVSKGTIAISVFALICAAVLIVYFAVIKPQKDEIIAENEEKQRQNEELEAELSPYNETFCPGIYVNGINLEGLTGDQAMARIQEQIRQQNSWSVKLIYGEKEAVITADMLDMTVDNSNIQQVLLEAWEPGHNVDGNKSNEERLAEIKQLRTENRYYYTYRIDNQNTAARIDDLLNQIKGTIDRPAQNASMLYFDPSLEYPFVFQDEEYGLTLDITSLKQQLYQMASSLQGGSLEIQPTLVEPTTKKADLLKHYSLISTAITPIDKHSTDNRNNNIRRSFEFINGYELKAGREFNFNRIVGKRTLANGFYTAEEYVYGEHQEGVGGGVCQASTTVYQAAVCAGLKINKRKPHSDSVSYTDYGKDATVYWFETDKNPRTDLIFTNNTEGTIYIVAVVEPDPSNKKKLRCRVSMYGEDLGNIRYELTSEIIDVLPPPVEEEIVDSADKVRKAKDGYKVRSYRLKYEGDVLTERKELFTDVYKPQAARVLRSD